MYKNFIEHDHELKYTIHNHQLYRITISNILPAAVSRSQIAIVATPHTATAITGIAVVVLTVTEHAREQTSRAEETITTADTTASSGCVTDAIVATAAIQ